MIRKFLVDSLVRVYRPVRKMALELWAEVNILIDPKESIDSSGPYRRGKSIFAARLLDEFMGDPEWRTLMVMKSSQSGFTLHVLILICRMIAEAPMNILYVIDSETKAKRLSKRLQRLLHKCKATKLEVEATETKLNTLEYDFAGMSMVLTGGQSAGQVASDPYGLAVNDEADKCKKPKGEAHIFELMISRIKAAGDGKAIGFSTPTVETGVTNKYYETGSQHAYFVPCPHCGEKQMITLESLRYAHCAVGKGYDYRRVKKETFMECCGCKGRIEEHHKEEMLLGGEVRPTNFREEIIDGKKVMVPAWMPGEMSAQHSDLYSLLPSSTWGIIVVEYLRALADPSKMQDFLNNRMGKPVKRTVSNINEGHVLRLKGDYKRGTLPVLPAIACMSIDNQGNHQKWVKYAFLPNGDMFVFDWGKSLALVEADDLVKIPVNTPNGPVYVQRIVIDEGGKDGTSYEVRAFCLPRYPVFSPMKGRGGIQVKNTVFFSPSAVSRGGLDKIPVCHFDDDAFKRTLYLDRIKKFDAQKSREFGYPRLWLPSDVSEEFVRELCGEQLVKELDSNGVPQYVWKPKPPNDFGDCLKMGYVLWNCIGASFQAAQA
ncbi:MAG: phage terminase large subunit family protein [Luteolibacter sp.]